MSYCVECGVELAEYHDKCPLCGTLVYNPHRKIEPAKSDYPKFKTHRSNIETKHVVRHLTGFVLTISFIASALITLFIDFKTSGSIGWSLYPALALLLLIFSLALPFFKKRNTFFGVFSRAWLLTSLFIVAVNLIANSAFTWSRYVFISMVFVWLLMTGIFSATRVRRFLPVLLLYTLSAIGYFIIIGYWLSDSSAVFSLILPLEGVLLIVFMATYFIIKSGFYGVINIIILALTDVLIISVLFDLIITSYMYNKFALTWSFIVALSTIPLIVIAVVIKKRLRLRGILSKKLHR